MNSFIKKSNPKLPGIPQSGTIMPAFMNNSNYNSTKPFRGELNEDYID